MIRDRIIGVELGLSVFGSARPKESPLRRLMWMGGPSLIHIRKVAGRQEDQIRRPDD